MGFKEIFRKKPEEVVYLPLNREEKEAFEKLKRAQKRYDRAQGVLGRIGILDKEACLQEVEWAKKDFAHVISFTPSQEERAWGLFDNLLGRAKVREFQGLGRDSQGRLVKIFVMRPRR